jgi:hypothetical protein
MKLQYLHRTRIEKVRLRVDDWVQATLNKNVVNAIVAQKT